MQSSKQSFTSQYSKSKFSAHPLYWESQDAGRLVRGCVAGCGGVGKSSVLRHFNNMGYLNDYRPTQGVEFVSKQFEDNTKLHVWDFPGDDRFMKIAASYFKGAHVFIIVYDVTNRGSFESIRHVEKYIADEAKAYRSVLLVANKTDLPGRQVNLEEGEAYARSKGYLYLETSCKTQNGDAIRKRFEELLYSHLCLGLPIDNFSEDNYARNIYGSLYQSILAKVNAFAAK